MIVKDEEKHLFDCLKSVKDITDEIIIVDTGSSDRTIEIAESFGAKIFQFNWINDFSAARNFALSKSTGDWILYLDADETLDPGSKEKLKDICKTNYNHGVRCKIYNVDDINKKPKLQSYTRLFKNSSGIEFRGKAHEQIDASLIEKNYKIIDSDILIYHFGYNIPKQAIKEKAQRNLKLLLNDYESNPSGYNAFQIANSYNILNDKQKTFDYFKLSLDDKHLPDEYRSLALSSIAEYYLRNNNINDALISIDKSLEVDPLNIVSNLTASEIYFKANKGSEAVSFCINAFEENKKGIAKKNNSRLLDIFYDEEMILYHGLHISYQSNEQTGIEYFFNKLEDLKTRDKLLWQKELDIIQHLTSNSVLSFEHINFITDLISEYNIDFYLGLLNYYQSTDIKILVEKKLFEKFPENLLVRNRYAHDLSKSARIDEAISIYSSTIEKFPEDTSAIFYLISLFLQKGDFNSLESLINSSKEKYSGNKDLIKQLNDFEEKVSSIKLNTN